MMMPSMQSLRALPPKQVLALALVEKARRRKEREQKDQMREMHARHSALLVGLPRRRPNFADVPSLVLDPSHPFYALLHQKAPYKIIWGGRGSAKSWSVAEALIRKAAVEGIRVLCAREFQTSIKDSSHKLLKDTIKRLGMGAWFHVTDSSITSRAGAEFMFRGLYNNEHGLRSVEGIDICWVEEAQTVSSASWRSLIPTIRDDDAEVWVTFNLINEEDATYQRFVVKPPTGALVIKANYDSNPFFSGRQRQDMEDDKENDYHLYEHIWLGMPLKVSNAIVYSGKYTVREFEDDLWTKADRLLYGMDFGFAQDPAALIRMFVLNQRLYIEYEAYGTGVENDELEEFCDSVPGTRDWPIKADNARPETISHIRRRGFNIQAAEKWDGCVKDGISHIRGYKQIIIHPRCVNTAREARLYRHKVDKNQVDDKGNPQVLPLLVDKDNHTWDAVRYGLDGYIIRSGEMGVWTRLGAGVQ